MTVRLTHFAGLCLAGAAPVPDFDGVAGTSLADEGGTISIWRDARQPSRLQLPSKPYGGS